MAIIGRRDLPLAPDPRTGFEMTLLRMLAFRPAGAAGQSAGAARPVTRAPIADAPAARAPAPAPTPSGTEASGSWTTIIGQLDLQGAARQLATHCVLLGRDGAVVRLALDPRNQLVRTRAQEEKLAQALSRHYGTPVRLEFVAEALGETPAQAEQRASVNERDAAQQRLEDDPTVRAFKERFGATLLPDTVRPAK